MDELFEALTLIQTGKIDPSPVLLFGESWWRRIVDFEAMVEEGVIAPEDLGIFRYVDTAEAAWAAVEAFYPGGRPPRRNRHRSEELGRASGRVGVCQYVYIPRVGVHFKKKTNKYLRSTQHDNP